jgi:hypothetical protein
MKFKFLISFFALSISFTQYVFTQNIFLDKDTTLKCTNNIVIASIQKICFDSVTTKFSKTDYSNINGFSFFNACRIDSNWLISSKKSFDAALKQLDNKKDFVLYIHGDGATFKETLERCLMIHDNYNVNVISFFWPSKVPELNGLKNFKNSFNNVKKYLAYFKTFLEMFQSYKINNSAAFANVHCTLLLHSLGNYFIENLVRDSLCSDLTKDLFDNIVLNAAAVPEKKHKAWVEKLNFQKNIFIISNKKDFSLNGVRLFAKWKRQLGERVKKPFAENAVYINFTKAIGFQTKGGNSHTYFLGKTINESSNIKNFYSDILNGKSPNINDSAMFHKRKDGSGFDIVK